MIGEHPAEIRFRLPEDLKTRISSRAREMDKSMSEFIRLAIETFLDKGES